MHKHISLAMTLTYVFISLSINEAAGVSLPRARHSEQERVGLHDVAVTGLELTAGHQQ